MAVDAGGHSQMLQFKELFPGVNSREYPVCCSKLVMPRRPTWLGSLIKIGTPTTHVGALIGPKR
jgi:hypothetical protein